MGSGSTVPRSSWVRTGDGRGERRRADGSARRAYPSGEATPWTRPEKIRGSASPADPYRKPTQVVEASSLRCSSESWPRN